MARLVVAAAVGVAVGYFAGPTVGFQAFTAVYGVTGFLDPNKKVLGPRLNDLKAPQASYGSPIPYVEGAPRLAGVYFWASNKKEVATTQSQGKGGPGVDSTTYSYEIDVLIGLAINQCKAVRRVWSNGKLVWSQADDADSMTLAASKATPSWRDLRFYSGAADQLPDPTYEAAVGMGNAPAYRNRTTVFIEGLSLGNSGQLPVLTFEVLSEVAASTVVEQLASVVQDRTYIGGIPAMSLDGFDMLTGNYVNQVITSFDVNHIGADGSVTKVGNFPGVAGPYGYINATGTSDVSCMVTSKDLPLSNVFVCAFADGSSVTYDASGVSRDPSNSGTKFCRTGPDVVIGGGFGMDMKLAHFDATSGGLLGSATLAQNVNSLAIGNGNCYALGRDCSVIYVLDLPTMTLQSTIVTPPVLSESSASLLFGDGVLFYLSPLAGAIYRYGATSWSVVQTGAGAVAGNATADANSLSYSAGSFLAQNWVSGATENHAVISYLTSRAATVLPGLDQVVSRLCMRTGQLGAGDIDVTALAGQVVRAMAVSQVGSTRQTLETLMGAYLFEAVEDDKIRFVPRGGAPALSIPYRDLGASANGTGDPLPKKRSNDMEIPAEVTIKYANVLNDFQDGTERGERLVTDSTAVSVIEMPLGFTPTEAKKLADANTMDLAVSLLAIGPISVSRKYSALEPTDVVALTDADGSTFRARITKSTTGSGICTFDLVLDDATVISSAAATDSAYTASTVIQSASDTVAELLDIPILRDADNDPGFYVAAKGTGTVWPGAQVYAQ